MTYIADQLPGGLDPASDPADGTDGLVGDQGADAVRFTVNQIIEATYVALSDDDPNLTPDTDDLLPTKSAVKAYVDANIGGVGQPVNRVDVVTGSAYYAFGDSITTGSGATNARWYYPARIATALGLTLTNSGLSGSATFYATRKAFADLPDFARRTTLATWLAGFNDIYRGGSNPATLTKIKGELRAFLANAFLETADPGSTQSTTGSWTNMDSSLFDKSSVGLGSLGKFTESNSATMTKTFSGDTLVIGCYNSDGATLRVGSFAVAVDGVTLETYDGDGLSDGISDGVYDNDLTHEARVYRNLGSGSHSLTISTTGASAGFPVYIDYLGTLALPNNIGPVIIGEPPLVNTAGWAHGGAVWSEAAMLAAADAINEVVAEFSDYPVAVAKVNDYYDPLTEISGDDEHPDDDGHASIAEAFEACVAPVRVPTTPLSNVSGVLAVANGGTGDDDAAGARANLSAAGFTQADEVGSWYIETPTAKTYKLAVKMPHAGTITEVTTISESGTGTAIFKVNTTALGGTGNSVSSSEQSQAHSGTNTFSAGDDLQVTLSSLSTLIGMTLTIKYTRTLA